ncbi:acyl-CoA dehydrogenase domain protein [Chytridium lagenaria]|nr:acyl-CoA dehydrogenase domain protein [Chytridium lagenaria]
MASTFFTLSPRVEKLRQTLHDFVEFECIPAEETFHKQMGKVGTAARWEIVPPIIEQLKTRAKSLGLWNIWLPNYYDKSPGLSNLEYAFFAKYGNDAQKKQYLEPLLNGTIRSAFAMTEPAVASSDATNISLSITKVADGYVVDGRKWWISGAGDPRCKVFLVMGKSDPTAKTHQQQSVIIVPADAPGVTVVRPMMVFGYDDAPHGHCEIVFDNVKVPFGNMILGEGRGFEIIQGRLGPGRIHHCMRSIGMAERALEFHLTRTFNKLIAQHGSTMDAIAASRAEIDQARLLVLRAADKIDRVGAKNAMNDIGLAKVVVPSMCLRVIDRAIQAHGAAGVCQDFPLAYMYAGQRTLRIADGPDEVHNMQIAKHELRKAEAIRQHHQKQNEISKKLVAKL